MTVVGLDADVLQRSQNTTPTDYAVTPVFQRVGQTLNPPEVIIFNSVQYATNNSVATGTSSWAQGMAYGTRGAVCASSWHEDGQGNADNDRTTGATTPMFVRQSTDTELLIYPTKWGYLNDGRSVWMDVWTNDQTTQVFHTSLLLNPMPWQIKGLRTPDATEPNWKISFPFEPDWVWMWGALIQLILMSLARLSTELVEMRRMLLILKHLHIKMEQLKAGLIGTRTVRRMLIVEQTTVLH